ncbi:MAG: ABC transporter permease subunit, partial [Myxococcota bacterium]
PSVVIGFMGITMIGPGFAWLAGNSHGLNAITGAVLLAVMALPTIVSISDDALRAVPTAWRDASAALGAGRFHTFVWVVLPGARSGLAAAAMLGVGRAVGETMTVLMATGNALAFPTGLDSSIRTLTATIAIEMGEVAQGSIHYHALFAIGLVLFAFSLGLNLLAERVLARPS